MPIWPTSSRVPRGQSRHAPFYRGEIGIPTFTGRGTERQDHIQKVSPSESWIFTHRIFPTYRQKNSKYLWTMLVLSPWQSAPRSDAQGRLRKLDLPSRPCGAAPRGKTKACFTPRRSHLTHGTYVLWLSDQWVESKSNDQVVTLRWYGPRHSRANMR
jgi:hypothetical protein